MSRMDGRVVQVEESVLGLPLAVRLENGHLLPVHQVVGRWREWLGALAGEPERDVWQVETPRGTLELHQVAGEWLLFRWED